MPNKAPDRRPNRAPDIASEVARVAAVILAGGAGTRFHGDIPKLLAPFRSRPLIAWAVDAAVDAALDEVVVVTGAVSSQDIRRVVPPTVSIIENPRWPEGQATSLAAAVEYARAQGYDAVVIGLGDQPLIEPAAWRTVATTLRQHHRPAGGEPSRARPGIVVATYGAKRRNPVGLHRSVWDQLPVTGDEGARVLMRARPDWVVEVACPGDPADVDSVEDLQQWS